MISDHLNHKPYQIASTADLNLPFRKWNHHGTQYAPTNRSAAYTAYKGDGNLISESLSEHGIVYRFSCGLYINVIF